MDIPCSVCTEPFDAYHIQHEMLPWERDLFREGAGCPCCEGMASETLKKLAGELHTKAVAIDVAWDDPRVYKFAERFLSHGDEATRAEWKKPEDPAVLCCQGCDNRILRDIDVRKPSVMHHQLPGVLGREIDGVYWDGTSFRQLYNHGIEWDDALEAFIKGEYELKIDGHMYCPNCVDRCTECEELLTSEEVTLIRDSFDAVCFDCLEQLEGSDGDA